jgi:hypothetical protein
LAYRRTLHPEARSTRQELLCRRHRTITTYGRRWQPSLCEPRRESRCSKQKEMTGLGLVRVLSGGGQGKTLIVERDEAAIIDWYLARGRS